MGRYGIALGIGRVTTRGGQRLTKIEKSNLSGKGCVRVRGRWRRGGRWKRLNLKPAKETRNPSTDAIGCRVSQSRKVRKEIIAERSAAAREDCRRVVAWLRNWAMETARRARLNTPLALLPRTRASAAGVAVEDRGDDAKAAVRVSFDVSSV